MRYVNQTALSASDNASTNGPKFDANQLVSASFHCFFGDDTANGVFKLQASNDIYNNQYMGQANFDPTNWVDIPSQSANITDGASALLTIPNMSYRWVRAVFEPGIGEQTVTTVEDLAKSLNSKYFLLYTTDGDTYYVWIDVDNSGVDPMIPDATGVEVDIAENDTAADVATAVAAAIDALDEFSAAAVSDVVTITNAEAGGFDPAEDGAAPTGFDFAITVGGTSTVTVNMNALSL